MFDILEGLNNQQVAAVTHPATPLLLLAGAGSGKTKVLTHRTAHFISQYKLKPENILLLTFTNKAAGEMKDRMEKILGGKTEITAGTFHSFACKLLRVDGIHIGIPHDFVIYDSSDQEGVIKQIVKELDLGPKEFKSSAVMYFIEKAKNSHQKPSEMKRFVRGYWEDMASQIYERYEKKLAEYKALDFNDLLVKVVDLLLEHPEVLEKYQTKYRAILVDEYQDTNQIQYLLTKLLAKNHLNITAVGDASQSIYGWRGADYRNLMSFTQDFANAKVLHLEQNYRSTQAILDAANAIISKNSSHPILKLFTQKPTSQKIKVFVANSELGEADYVARTIDFLHKNVHLAYKDIAVLYRMNAQSRTIEEAFLRLGIPYVLIGGIKFYDRAEIKDLISLVRYMKNPNDAMSEERVEKAIGKRKRATLDEFLKTYNYTSLTTTQILEDLLRVTNYMDSFDKEDEEDARRIENIVELNSVAQSHQTVDDFLENIALVQQEYSLQEKNKKDESKNGVRLMTLHASKGLEFDAVFLVGFEEGILPHSQSMIDESDIEEERRLAYVGVTRAREFLYITYAEKRLYFGKSSLNEPSRFLSDIPEKLLELEEDDLVRDYRPKANKKSDDFFYDPDIY